MTHTRPLTRLTSGLALAGLFCAAPLSAQAITGVLEGVNFQPIGVANEISNNVSAPNPVFTAPITYSIDAPTGNGDGTASFTVRPVSPTRFDLSGSCRARFLGLSNTNSIGLGAVPGSLQFLDFTMTTSGPPISGDLRINWRANGGQSASAGFLGPLNLSMPQLNFPSPFQTFLVPGAVVDSSGLKISLTMSVSALPAATQSDQSVNFQLEVEFVPLVSTPGRCFTAFDQPSCPPGGTLTSDSRVVAGQEYLDVRVTGGIPGAIAFGTTSPTNTTFKLGQFIPTFPGMCRGLTNFQGLTLLPFLNSSGDGLASFPIPAAFVGGGFTNVLQFDPNTGRAATTNSLQFTCP